MHFRPINAKHEQNFIGLSYWQYHAGRKRANHNYYNKLIYINNDNEYEQ